MRRFQQLSCFCLVTVVAISLTCLCGCDLGTYSKRSTDYLQANPGGMNKEMKEEMKKEKMEKEEMQKEETSSFLKTSPLMVKTKNYSLS